LSTYIYEKDIEEHKKRVWDMLEKAAAAAKDYVPTSKEWLSASSQSFPSPRQLAEETLPTRATGSDEVTLKRIGKAISSYPPGFTPHRKLARILRALARRWKRVATSTSQQPRPLHLGPLHSRRYMCASPVKMWSKEHSLSGTL